MPIAAIVVGTPNVATAPDAPTKALGTAIGVAAPAVEAFVIVTVIAIVIPPIQIGQAAFPIILILITLCTKSPSTTIISFSSFSALPNSFSSVIIFLLAILITSTNFLYPLYQAFPKNAMYYFAFAMLYAVYGNSDTK